MIGIEWLYSLLRRWQRPKTVKVDVWPDYNDFDVPVRTELLILGPDDPKQVKLGFSMREKLGSAYTNDTERLRSIGSLEERVGGGMEYGDK